MKPRLRIRHGIWDCRLPDFRTTGAWGFGATPAEAYRAWLEQQQIWQAGRP